MDFLDPKKRRQNGIMLMIGYVLVAVVVFMATVVLIYYANGFGVSRDGSLTQRSLVFLSSQPTNSAVFIDGVRRADTDTKVRLRVGAHQVRITRTGYHDWSRKIMVAGSDVDHYSYPQLIPQKLESAVGALYDTAPLLASQSPDKRWLLTQLVVGDRLTVYDLQQSIDTIATTEPLIIPETLLTVSTTPATWSVAEWSANNRHILMNRTYTTTDGQKRETLLIDRERIDGSHNLTRELALTPDMQVTLRNNSPDSYFVYSPVARTVSTATLESPTLTLYQDHVLGYKTSGNAMMLYATDVDAADTEARIVLRTDKTSYFLRTVPRAERYLLAMARYDDNWYVAAGSPVNSRVYLFKNPMTTIDANTAGQPKVLFAFNLQNPSELSIATKAQFIAVQNGTAFQVYDAEFNRAYNWQAPFVIDGPNKFATWIDGYRFTYVSQGRQVIVEYDGLNAHELAEAAAPLGGFFGKNNTVLYTFAPAPEAGKTSLLRTPLRTPADQ